MLIAYKNALKRIVCIDKFCLIEVGYFSGTVTWLKDRTLEEGIAFDEAIMQAQEHLPLKDNDFVLLTQICKTFCKAYPRKRSVFCFGGSERLRLFQIR